MAKKEGEEVKKVSALTIILVLIVSFILMFSLMYASLNYFTGFSFVKTGGLGLSVQCDKITANISDTNKKGAYVTAQFVLEVKSKRDLKFVDRNKPVINTIALKTLRKLTYDKLQSNNVIDNVAESLVIDINEALGKEVIKGIYFNDFAWQ